MFDDMKNMKTASHVTFCNFSSQLNYTSRISDWDKHYRHR